MSDVKKILKNTSNGKRMKSSELLKKSKIEVEELWDLLNQLSKNGTIIRKSNDVQKQKGNPTHETLMKNDAYSFFLSESTIEKRKSEQKQSRLKSVGIILACIGGVSGLITIYLFLTDNFTLPNLNLH